MRSSRLALAVLLGACQSYHLEAVDPQTVIAVETAGTFTSAKAPILLIVQDRSGSMNRCFGEALPADPGHLCDNDADPAVEADGRFTRMEVARDVISSVVQENASGVFFGLTAYGSGTADNGVSCGGSQVVVEPGASASPLVVAAYSEQPLLSTPFGGTPTTAALDEAYNALVDDSGTLRDATRKNFVVLVTDGLMNCNDQFPANAACICSSEAGCRNQGGGDTAYGEVVPNPDSRLRCLDFDASVASVAKLRDAGVSTFVIGMGDALEADIAVRTLNELAIAGGVPRPGDVRFFPAADPGALETALRDIVRSITAPCTYELDGAVCDGRLVSISLSVKADENAEPKVIETKCDEAKGENTWFFDNGNARKLAFDPALCRQLEDATEVKITIRGVENDCPADATPSCGAAATP